ncbi:hypothetical protein W97_08265 [Coniosporium apollinis CBS 100218]|uniref:CENP-V/GFA domain-containing protein n=1 Tax=Coniosporium apollinis (strain CBS 100218) TaxID=1168221 RepID=R7Z4B9_CONA1|nr:uncharacterized protein W97_08265 [Coniosporium apollinis CBS 100218]EON69007.1 hypothetical protein W97_08265 [Coniosporium apollinis CBS 100218]
MEQALRGSCACGRNRYVVEIPPSSAQLAGVFLDNSSSSRRHQASPITAWLRVPIDWYHSATYAFFPDETHRSIRRSFVSPFSPFGTRREFCGYCGTQLSSWNERTREDAEFISLTVGSVMDDDLEILDRMGLLPERDEGEETDEAGSGRAVAPAKRQAQSAVLVAERNRGAPWFEEMVQQTRLGRIKRQKGGHTSNDGSMRVEWEIVEYEGDTEDGTVTGKRKIGEMEDGREDVVMRAA